MARLSIVLPVHNEENRIGRMVDILQDWICEQDHQIEVIMVLNGITDGTKNVLKEREVRASRIDIKIIELPFADKGIAVWEGLSNATGDYVVTMDADCSFHPNQIPRLLTALKNCDLAIGSRRHRETICRDKPPRYREILGFAYNRLVRLLFSIAILDTQSGLKAMTKVIRDLAQDADTDGFCFDTDLILRAHRRGFRVCEVPIEYVHMKGSKFRAKDIFNMLCDVARIWLEIHKRKKQIGYDETSVRKFYDSQEDIYFGASHSSFLPRRWWRNSKDRMIITALELKDSSSVLDAGCGNGVLANRISESARLVCAVDIGSRAVQFANKQRRLLGLDNVSFIRGDCRALPFRDQFFDRVVCSELLEHVRAPRRAVRELSRVLSLGGICIVTSPRNNLRWAMVEFIWTRIRREIQEVHHHAISETRLITILKRNGFKGAATWPMLLGCLTLAKATPLARAPSHATPTFRDVISP